MNLKELYQEIILDHGKNPRNLRKSENFNKDAKGHNPLCGDHVHVFLKIDENKKVEDISFEGHGCAISMASASIMTDLVRGKEEFEVKEILNDFLEMIKEKDELKTNLLKEDEKTKLMCLSGVKQYPMRVKCATLSWHTLTSALDNSQQIVKTEDLLKDNLYKKFRGIGLDVTDPEPLEKKHIFYKAKNIFISPHVAGPSDMNRHRGYNLIKLNITRYLKRKSLINVVDKEKEY